jgi:hypothetical protein
MKKKLLYIWRKMNLPDKEKLAQAKAQLDFKNTK